MMEVKMIARYLWDTIRAALLLLAVMLALPALSAEETSPTASDMEILREKIYADKKLLVAENMELTEEEAKKFWPVYEAYQEDLHKINERMAKLINEYALAYSKGAILDKTAKDLIDQAIEVELDEAKLRKSYVPKLSKVLPGVKVARYLQIENKIRAVVRYELASAIPLVY
jgi:Spy/CpxP family protein refolding chaperone